MTKETPKQAAPAPEPFITINGSTVKPEEVQWLWHPYIPFGKLTIIEGQPGLGKSWLMCDVAARLSRGVCLPLQDDPHPPCSTLMLSAEDGLEDTLAPRLIKLRADMSKIYFPAGRFTLSPANILRLEATMRQVAATAVFIDPIQSYFGSNRDMNKANDVRAFMDALADVASRCSCAVILIRHLRKEGKKDEGGDPLYKGLGSIDWVGAARSVLQATRMKSDEKVLTQVKSNLAKQGPSLGFDLLDDGFVWTGVKTQEELQAASPKSSPKHDAVVEWITQYLDGRMVPSNEAIRDGMRAGFTQPTLVKIKAKVAKSTKRGEQWFWQLQTSVQEALDAARPTPGKKKFTPANGALHP